MDPLIYTRPMRTAVLPETDERRCLHCQSEQIEPVGRVSAGGGRIKEEVRCAACQTVFWFVKLSLT